MSNNRTQILNMLAEGKIKVEEAEKLLNALNEEPRNNETSTSNTLSTPKNPKYLRVLVDSKSSETGHPETVNVKVPIQLLRAGIKLSSVLPDDASHKIHDAISDHGLNINLNDVNPENIDELIKALNDLTVDVNDGKTTVKVYCE
jgi:SHOCT-like domain